MQLCTRLGALLLGSVLALSLHACSGGGSSSSSDGTVGGAGDGGDGGGGDDGGNPCTRPPPLEFTVVLPLVGQPPDEEEQGWERPDVWEGHSAAEDDSITIPNGRPIYALLVSGYESNRYLDELLFYKFARHLMEQGAYVHFAWWNNLLAPYMERPLHHPRSYPGDLDEDLFNFTTANQAAGKALPGEDYQFVADAERLLQAIRDNNPNAMIVVVGHSMGGGAVVHLARRTGVLIDVLAPIDPCNNRNYPWGGGPLVYGNSDYFNWTRWRVTRDTFLGFKDWGFHLLPLPHCEPRGPWKKDIGETINDDGCHLGDQYYHDAPRLVFGAHVANLFHRFQQEAKFPYDYDASHTFGHTIPPGGTSSQEAVAVKSHFCGFPTLCSDPGGWPNSDPTDDACCPTGEGVGWNDDGHGEIVGYRGPVRETICPLCPIRPIPLASRVRTSPQCVACPGLLWPSRAFSGGTWDNGDGGQRKAMLEELEALPAATDWPHRPANANLCLVSDGLVELFDTMNRPPEAVAGDDQDVECTGSGEALVVLDGTASGDPDAADLLEYTWTWSTGSATGPTATVALPLGTYCITLRVEDPTGHYDEDLVSVTVADTTPPELTLGVTPDVLWPPNHRMVDIHMTVEAADLCGSVRDLRLVSIESSDADDGNGDGHTTGDVAGAELGTLDLQFQVRAERSGNAGIRTYRVVYEAFDDALNRAERTALITVRNPNP